MTPYPQTLGYFLRDWLSSLLFRLAVKINPDRQALYIFKGGE